MSKTNFCRAHALLVTLFLLLIAGLPVSAALPNTALAWGLNNKGQTNVPASLNGVAAAIAAGEQFTVALKTNGTVTEWGYYYSFPRIPSALSNVTAIVAGSGHAVALKANGVVVTWGDGNFSSTDMPTGVSNVTAIAAGRYHSLALKTNGTVVAWGNNDVHQTDIPVGLSNVTIIGAGAFHSFAAKANGTVVGWGKNDYGQASVPVGLSNVTAIAGGWDYTLALKNDGTVVAWGRNDYGQTNVPVGLSNVTAIAGGWYHALALKNDGTVVAWGAGKTSTGIYPEYGQAIVSIGLSNVAAIAGGAYHAAAIVRVAPPVITSEPVGLVANATSNVVFSVTATGTSPLYYQWFGLPSVHSGATGTALMAGGFVYDTQIIDGGSGYTQPPLVSFVGGGGNGASATATISNGTVVAISIVNPGSGYSSPPSLQIDPPNGFLVGKTSSVLTLTNVSTNNAGTYFVVITNSYGSATSSPVLLTVNVPVTITLQPQSVVTVLSSNATFTVSASSAGPLSFQWYWQPDVSHVAIAVPDVRNGFVVGASIIFGGSYYPSSPGVQFLNGGGSGATATAIVSNGVVSAVNIISPGSGYTSNTVIQIDPPGVQLLSGQTATNLSLLDLTSSASGNYFVVATTTGGSATSSLVSLRVLIPQRMESPRRLGDGRMQLTFRNDGGSGLPGDLGKLLLISTDEFLGTNTVWTTNTSGFTTNNGYILIEDLTAPNAVQRFYRVIQW